MLGFDPLFRRWPRRSILAFESLNCGDNWALYLQKQQLRETVCRSNESVRRCSSDGHGSVGVFARWKGEELFQLPLKCLECRSVHLVLRPAFQHDVVEGLGAVAGARHSVAVLDLVQHFCVRHPYKTTSGELAR